MKDLQIVEEQATALVDTTDYKDIAIQWLTSTGNLMKFTESEKSQFIDMCVALNLNPIKREIYGIKYNNSFNIVIGYNVYLKRAERLGKLDGWKVEVTKSGNEMIAKCTIWRKDWTHPFEHSVLLSEYNSGNGLWKTKPVTMIKKVAVMQTFRNCFPDEMGSLPYGEEEISGTEMTRDTHSPASPKERNVTPPTKSAAQTPKLYTKEQADELSKFMNATYPDGADVFSQEEKDTARQMLMDGLFEDALKNAKELLQKRIVPGLEDVAESIEVDDPSTWAEQ